ncbi:hypothetical protein [Psychrobacter proteolyticus]|uniref:hypothetical protein n=1 Tax=Psychrobacter proteolyticus TaxID=147825 RepID=UPI00311DBDE2
MDPFAFATIVGLLATFQSGREGKRDIEEFKHWLEENNHSNMVSIIENNQNIQQQLTAFMNQNHDQVMSQLATLNDLMVSIASHIQGLGNIASSFAPNSGLSEQAVDVLRQFVESGSVRILHIQTQSYEGVDNIYSLDNGGIEYSEPRFIETDIDSLVNAGLITMTKGNNGGGIYRITRQAVSFIDAIDSKN